VCALRRYLEDHYQPGFLRPPPDQEISIMKYTDGWDLIALGHYDDAATELAEYIDGGSIHVGIGHFANKAIAEVAAGRPLEAEQTLTQGDAFAERGNASFGSLLLKLSQVQWLNGHVEEAVSSLMSRIQGLKEGSMIYADSAGGGEEGLILNYYGVRLDRTPLIESAHDWLNRVLRRNRFGLRSWPGPLVRWFFGELDDVAALTAACGAGSMETALVTAKTDVLARRQLIEFCFHRAVRAYAEGERSRSRELLETVVSLENPLVEDAWFLARREIELAETVAL
jgi:hypothetical protein